jgi:hypothetical protein
MANLKHGSNRYAGNDFDFPEGESLRALLSGMVLLESPVDGFLNLRALRPIWLSRQKVVAALPSHRTPCQVPWPCRAMILNFVTGACRQAGMIGYITLRISNWKEMT